VGDDCDELGGEGSLKRVDRGSKAAGPKKTETNRKIEAEGTTKNRGATKCPTGGATRGRGGGGPVLSSRAIIYLPLGESKSS